MTDVRYAAIVTRAIAMLLVGCALAAVTACSGPCEESKGSTIPLPHHGCSSSSCHGVYESSLGVGQECVLALFEDCEKCRSTLVCNGASTRCEQPHARAIDEPCDQDLNCQASLVCNTLDFVRRCEMPGTRTAGEPCGATVNCAAGLVCGTIDPVDVCVPPGQLAALCTADDECATGLVCNTGFTPHECHVPGAVGERCGGRAEDCMAGLACDTTIVPFACR